MFVWILSGGGLGILMAWGVQIWVKRTGDSKYYDWACKVTLGIGFIGFVVAGILIQYKIDNFGLVPLLSCSLSLLFSWSEWVQLGSTA